MAKPIEPLLPVHTPSPKGAVRPRLSDRISLTGTLRVLHSGIPFEYLHKERGLRLQDNVLAEPARLAKRWRRQHLHETVLHKLRQHDQIEWERASINSASVPPPTVGGDNNGLNPTERG